MVVNLNYPYGIYNDVLKSMTEITSKTGQTA